MRDDVERGACAGTAYRFGTFTSGCGFASIRIPAVRWVVFTGLDGYRGCLLLDDALADGVLLADGMDGIPLTVDHGAPLRLVAPSQYGYKSVKHVCVIEYRREYDPGSARWLAHPRGRVAREERGRFLPGRMWRPLWRALLPRVRRLYERD